jgi:hypothetical protein
VLEGVSLDLCFSITSNLTFVDDIPLGAVVTPSGSKSLNMVFHDLDQSGIVEAAVGDP